MALWLWADEWTNAAVTFWYDNQAVVHVVNSLTSRSQRVMVLAREFTLHCLQFSIVFQVRHVPDVDNSIADALSHQQMDRFMVLAPGGMSSSRHPTTRGMESWRAETNRAMSLAVAPSTRRSYATACNEYFAFCEQEGLDHSWSAPDDQLMQFAV